MNTAVLSEADYDEIEPEIVELVRTLNAVGIVTKSSCGGHTDTRHQYWPYVLIDHQKTNPGLLANLIDAIAWHNMHHNALLDIFCLKPEWTIVYGDSRLFTSLQPIYQNENNIERHLELLRKSTKVLAEDIRAKMPEIV